MALTERKIIEELGYSKGQIRRRRSIYWVEGQHYYKDPANTYVYDKQEIVKWQKENIQVSTKMGINAGLNTKLTRNFTGKLQTSNGHRKAKHKLIDFAKN